MSVRMIARPLTDWPGVLLDDDARVGSPFRASWTDTVDLLDKEVFNLGGREVIVQLALAERDMRLDGWIRADAKPKHPGVTIVVPDSDQGRVSFSTDRYRTRTYGYGAGRSEGWQANVRAIALSMEALRAADRHGLMQGRQYAGFRELGSGIAMGAGEQMTVEDAARFIAEHVEGPHVYRDQVTWARRNGYRLAAKRLHPDVGGDAALFARLQEAKAVLDQHGDGI